MIRTFILCLFTYVAFGQTLPAIEGTAMYSDTTVVFDSLEIKIPRGFSWKIASSRNGLKTFSIVQSFNFGHMTFSITKISNIITFPDFVTQMEAFYKNNKEPVYYLGTKSATGCPVKNCSSYTLKTNMEGKEANGKLYFYNFGDSFFNSFYMIIGNAPKEVELKIKNIAETIKKL